VSKQIKIKDLVPDNKNYNKGTEFGGSLIEKSLRKLGAGRSILLDKNNRIIAGNKTIENAGAIGLEDVIVVETTGNQIVAVKRTDIDLDSKKGREMALADNATAKANIDWDVEALNEDWSTDEQKEWGVEFPDFAVNLEAEEDDYEIPDTIQTDIVLGDLFEIGQHRLLCGDSTNADDVAKLMNGHKADMVFTDPPYNINYGNIKHPKFKVREIENDNMSGAEFEDFCNGFISNIVLFNKGCVYMAGPPGPDGRIMFMAADKALHCSTVIIWNKDQFTLGRGKYKNKYEPIWFGWVDNGTSFYGDRTQTNVWDIPRPKASQEHPTMKPVELVAKAVNHASRKDDIVLDLFGGSGTTMVASEQLGRKAYLNELDPKYCQVIVDRMLKLDPSLEIKRNGQLYISNKAEINAI
jgi:DNA modification methylase